MSKDVDLNKMKVSSKRQARGSKRNGEIGARARMSIKCIAWLRSAQPFLFPSSSKLSRRFSYSFLFFFLKDPKLEESKKKKKMTRSERERRERDRKEREREREREKRERPERERESRSNLDFFLCQRWTSTSSNIDPVFQAS